MRAYLQSSIDKVERIETLRESLGCPPFRFDDLTRRAADAARVAIGTNDMLDWTRSLTHAQADALIEALEDERQKP